ncbi:Malate dehydrogenase, cytoplasmic [Bagarius yarrelli]|uniref:Malate dehydrogenase, cytoplasmic n=1 Tax=Bagarius yarrelli TaxID=175774 RepID=A0A556VAR1_BAGYA|nr:Malate dehydrogenase, cytoplasmic [Bagarius yarrelli]
MLLNIQLCNVLLDQIRFVDLWIWMLVLFGGIDANLHKMAANLNISGKADCPYYAKAELLADLLRRILPDFRIHKICMLPSVWEKWLNKTCSSNGWRHESSPLVWRELTGRGGKAMLLGGFNDFLEYAQGYYGITSDMKSELMLNIAAENLKMKEHLLQEEETRRKLHKSFHIWITSALNPVCYHLVPMLFTSDTLATFPSISLHLLDVDANEESLLAFKMEVEDMVLSQLHQVDIHPDLNQAFQSANLIIVFLEDREPSQDSEQQLGRIVERFDRYGRLIEDKACKDVRVLVVGDVSVHLKCSLLIEKASSMDPRRFVAIATQLEGEARTQIAIHLSVQSHGLNHFIPTDTSDLKVHRCSFFPISDITDVIIWGNINGHFHVDLQRAKVHRYQGAIRGPEGFFQKVLEMIYNGKWVQNDFPGLVSSRRKDITLKTNKTTAISASRGIIATLDAWLNGSSYQIFSLGVVSTGNYGIPAGLVFCVPVTFQKGEWSECSDIIITEDLQRQLEAAVDEITAVST